MTESIIVALISGGLTLAGTVLTITSTTKETYKNMDAKLDKQQAVMDTKLDELTREVREHNGFAQRLPVVEEQIKVINHRLSDLEYSHHSED